MKVAIVSDWVAFIGGAEKTLLEILKCFPQADLFATLFFLKPAERELFGDINIKTSFIQNLPFAKNKFEYYLPLMPLAIEQFDLRGYDLIISTSHAFAKNVITAPEQLHISYVYSPIRYAWDMQNVYLENSHNMSGKIRNIFARTGLHYLRFCDLRSVNAVDEWLCISNYINSRIRKYYDRNAQVIYPPVDVPDASSINYENNNNEKYFVTCSRLVEYKRIDLIVSAFVKDPSRKLMVIGEGPMENKLKALAKKTKNITFCGRLSENEKNNIIANAQAFIFAAKEDFGIAPVEAQALGVPVIAFGSAGALETIIDIEEEAPTGIYFYEQTPEAILEAVEYFEQKREKFVPAICRINAGRFSPLRFREEFTQAVKNKWDNFVKAKKL